MSEISKSQINKTTSVTTKSYQLTTIFAQGISKKNSLEIARLLVRSWPVTGESVTERAEKLQTEWANYNGPVEQAPRSLVIRVEEKVVAHALMQPRLISVETKKENISLVSMGLARVCVAPDFQRQRYGQLIIQSAFQLVKEGKFPWVLFQVGNHLVDYYAGLGAMVVPVPVRGPLAIAPYASMPEKVTFMIYSPINALPGGPITIVDGRS